VISQLIVWLLPHISRHSMATTNGNTAPATLA
jgi:hypothetical protein